jgi:hypothetical protein
MLKQISAAVAALALMQGVAVAAPTETNITSPSNPSFVAIDRDAPTVLHVTGTTTGGAGDIDLRCYYGDTSVPVASGVAVSNGSFETDVPLGDTLLAAFGYGPHPYCTLRAVPTTTTPAAAPDAQSPWHGAEVGWGEVKHYFADLGVADYFIADAQSGAYNDYYAAASCGLCDTYLFAPGTKAPSNGIWWANSGLYKPRGFANRMGVRIDGTDAYTGVAGGYNGFDINLGDNPGFPPVVESHTTDPLTGDLTIQEHSAHAACAPQPATFPPMDVSCASFSATGVVLDREVRQTDNGLRVTIVDRWKSTDGQAHSLDAVYEDTVHSANAINAGHEARANFTWTPDGFSRYDKGTQIPVPASAPATVLVKTDRSVPDAGDLMNPFGAVVLGSRPTELRVVDLGETSYGNNHWDARYERTIPADGEVVITVAYVADFSLDVVKAKAKAIEAELTPPQPPAPPSDDAPPAGDAPPPSAPATPAAVDGSAPATAPVACVVPKLHGKTLAAAKLLLKRAHCALGKVSRKASKRVKPGRVLATRVKAGTRVRAGARIRVTVARKL